MVWTTPSNDMVAASGSPGAAASSSGSTLETRSSEVTSASVSSSGYDVRFIQNWEPLGRVTRCAATTLITRRPLSSDEL